MSAWCIYAEYRNIFSCSSCLRGGGKMKRDVYPLWCQLTSVMLRYDDVILLKGHLTLTVFRFVSQIHSGWKLCSFSSSRHSKRIMGATILEVISNPGLALSSESSRGLTLWDPVVPECVTRFNVKEFYILSTQCIYVFCVDLRTNSDYFPIQH